tara:strand:+ start:1929 stop:2420 length:492 start_codon:yes stop_codon:yes gene_type:complete
MSKKDIKQFRLSTGEEIICEILEWDDEDTSAMLARGILKIVESEDWKQGIRLIAFRPFMAFNEDPDIIQTINSEHVIAESTPADGLMKMYARCIRKVKQDIAKYPDLPTFDVDDLNDLSDDELREYVTGEMDRLSIKKAIETDIDSDNNDNVIKFKPKDTTFH